MEQSMSQLPSPSEKQSIKFILDEIRDRKAQETLPSQSIPDEPTLHTVSPTIAPSPSIELPPGKKYFRIGEVSELVGVESYVLRYWESEFRAVRPVKSSAGHRVYSREDVELLLKIRRLLHIEKFSIKGAKRALAESKSRAAAVAVAPTANVTFLKSMATELKALIQCAKGWW